MATRKKSPRGSRPPVKRQAVLFQSVTFWINAFLPRDITGATTLLRRGPYAGYTAISGPLYCLTDQRNFSNDPRAQVRMQSQVTIDFSGDAPALTQTHRCDPTTECDAETGEVRCQRRASTERMQFALTAVAPQVAVRMSCGASNPGTSASWAFADIDYTGTLVIDPIARSLAVDLKISLFPAFEGYASINEGMPILVFRYAPPAGLGPGRGPSGANRPIRTLLVDQDGDGVF